MLSTNIDLSKAKEPKHHHNCHRCGAISVGEEKPIVRAVMSDLHEEETAQPLVVWKCTEYGHKMATWELPEKDRQFLLSMSIQPIPGEEVTDPKIISHYFSPS